MSNTQIAFVKWLRHFPSKKITWVRIPYAVYSVLFFDKNKNLIYNINIKLRHIQQFFTSLINAYGARGHRFESYIPTRVWELAQLVRARK